MFEPFDELVSTHRLRLASGEAIVYDQSLWGKVLLIRELHVDGGRFDLEDALATARLRQLLEAATYGGEWAFEAEHPMCQSIRSEVRDVIQRLFGDPFSD